MAAWIIRGSGMNDIIEMQVAHWLSIPTRVVLAVL